MLNERQIISTLLPLSKIALNFFALCATFCISLSAVADQFPAKQSKAISVEYMTGSADMHGMRLAYRPDLNYDLDIPLIGKTRLEWEASLNLFDLHGSAKNEATYGLSVSPVFSTSLPNLDKNHPLRFEFGIGVVYVHEQKFGGVDIGSYYQFEDRLGLLIGLDKGFNSEVALRYIHYSNGGLNTKNPGLDFFSVGYIKRF